MVWARRRTELRSRRPGRHRLGAPGLTWCREYGGVAATLAGPTLARRGLFETLFATARHAIAAAPRASTAPRASAPRASAAVPA